MMVELTVLVVMAIGFVVFICWIIPYVVQRKIKKDEKNKQNKPRVGWKK